MDFVRDADRAADQVRQYFAGNNGQVFDRIAHETPSDRFTWADFYAVASLSTIIPGATALRIIECQDLRHLLRQVPADASIADASATEELTPGGPADQLYGRIRSLSGMGKARTSKLLAVKRPHLIPIRDSVVERKLGAAELWWMPMRDAWTNGQLRSAIAAVRTACNGQLPAYVTDLRVLDVAIWMDGRDAW